MKRFLLVIMALLSSYMFGQKYELGEVTLDELKEKVCKIDTTAEAAILFKKGKIEFNYRYGDGFKTSTDVEIKIKIYKKEGLEYANQVVRYYIDGYSKETVNIISAITYNLVDGKIIKAKLKSDGEFDENINKYWAKKKITFPNVKEGSVLEFKYRIISPNYGRLEDWRFQGSLPVYYSNFQTSIPEYFVYNPYLRGYLSPVIEKDSKEKKFEGTYQEMVNGRGGFRSERGTYEVKYREDITRYTLTNIPALKDEKFVNNIANYYSTLQLELSSIRMPNQPFENFSTSWESVAKKIYESTEFGDELKKTGYYEDEIKKVLEGKTTRDEKVFAVFEFVKNRLTWDGTYGYYCDKGVRKAYLEKTGNCAEINLMLISMLRFAGIDASPILVSTRSNGINLFPSRTAYNYVIAGVEIENDIILLDATDKYSMPNVLPERVLNWIGRIIRKTGSSADIDLMPKKASRENTNIVFNINTDAKIEGKLRTQSSDNSALGFRTKYNSLTEESYLEKLEKKLNGVEISEYQIENKTDPSNPIVETFSFNTNNQSEIIGDKIYINPMLFYTLNENPFKQDKREYPIDFIYPTQDKYTIIINLPDGYQVESMPSLLNLAFADNEMFFKYNISVSPNKIQLVVSLDINVAILSPENYDELKAFFNEVVKKQTEKIVLKKI